MPFPRVNVGDQEISFRQTGKGKPLICVHGIAGHERTYDGILPFLSPFFEVFQLAWPGYGEAPLRGRYYTIDDQVRWIEGFRQHFGFRRIYLMGNCIGANVVMEYAYKYPERLDFLIINEPHAFMPAYFYLLLYPVIKDVLWKFMFKTRLGRSILMRVFPLEDEEGTGYTERRLKKVPTRVMEAFLRSMYLYERSTDLLKRPRVKVPSLFPIPKETFGQVAEFVNRYGGCFENLKHLRVKGAVHNPVVEDAETFARAVLPELGIKSL
ncbi:alpha/beta fold hydrolase [candidate division WOR-3 bacterium]|nr:alpha/beta fold hydrolase [candidate division WOR-3 bacterium]